MLVELCNRALPYSSQYLTPMQVALAVSDRSLCPTLDSPNYPTELIELIEACLQHEPALRPHFLTIVQRLQGIIAGVEQVEAEQASSSQGSLFGRMSGMIQGVAHQAQVAATGIQRDPSRIWGRTSSVSARESQTSTGAPLQTPRFSSGVPPSPRSTGSRTFLSPPPPPPQAEAPGWQMPPFIRTPQPQRPSPDAAPMARPPPVPMPAPHRSPASRPGLGPATKMPGIGRLASRINASPIFQGFMARAGHGDSSRS
jgi:hypothetical protein